MGISGVASPVISSSSLPFVSTPSFGLVGSSVVTSVAAPSSLSISVIPSSITPIIAVPIAIVTAITSHKPDIAPVVPVNSSPDGIAINPNNLDIIGKPSNPDKGVFVDTPYY